MAILERVMQLKEQGLEDQQIALALRQEGYNPKEIMDSISQSKIKIAISKNEDRYSGETSQYQDANQEFVSELQPSIMSNSQQSYQPEVQFENGETIPSSYQPSTTPYEEYQENQLQPGYAQEYYQPVDFQSIAEIAEQIIEEKIEELNKKVSSSIKGKEETAIELETLQKRIEKLENLFNTLQMDVLKKIGQYGEDINSIAKEMHSNQETFSKLVNPLTDNMAKNRNFPEETNAEKSRQIPRKKSKAEFENYLR